jgi:hypothetical protein
MTVGREALELFASFIFAREPLFFWVFPEANASTRSLSYRFVFWDLRVGDHKNDNTDWAVDLPEKSS